MYWYKHADIKELVFQRFKTVKVNQDNDELHFLREDGSGFVFFHYQDCCERVDIEDIAGYLSDLEDAAILLAEESVSHMQDPPGYTPSEWRDESWTWTFYKFATAKGYVTVRWYGTSNGYYSEHVSIRRV